MTRQHVCSWWMNRYNKNMNFKLVNIGWLKTLKAPERSTFCLSRADRREVAELWDWMWVILTMKYEVWDVGILITYFTYSIISTLIIFLAQSFINWSYSKSIICLFCTCLCHTSEEFNPVLIDFGKSVTPPSRGDWTRTKLHYGKGWLINQECVFSHMSFWKESSLEEGYFFPCFLDMIVFGNPVT